MRVFRLTSKKVRELLLVALNAAYKMPTGDLLSDDELIEEMVASDDDDQCEDHDTIA